MFNIAEGDSKPNGIPDRACLRGLVRNDGNSRSFAALRMMARKRLGPRQNHSGMTGFD
jgi:hypothetical protein